VGATDVKLSDTVVVGGADPDDDNEPDGADDRQRCLTRACSTNVLTRVIRVGDTYRASERVGLGRPDVCYELPWPSTGGWGVAQ
jgi:hypothetical protein